MLRYSVVSYPALGPDASWWENYPYWSNPNIFPRSQIGDCYAMMANAILTTQQPYPGDELFDVENLRPELRFEVTVRPKTKDSLRLFHSGSTGARTSPNHLNIAAES